MSMNLHVCAKLSADTKLGKKTITESFDLWQTPTKVTRQCLGTGEPIAAYKKYITEECCHSVMEPVYAPGDIFGEYPPVSVRWYCAADEHLEALDVWIEEHEGWKIDWYEL